MIRLDAVLVAVGVGDAPGAARRRTRRASGRGGRRPAAPPPGTSSPGPATSPAIRPSCRSPASLAGSTGNSRVGRMSTPVRSRIVWSYSALLSRRAGTGPGSPGRPLRLAARGRRVDPGDHVLPGLGRSAAAFFGSAASSRLELLEDRLPPAPVLGHRVGRGVGAQVEVALRLVLAVAAEAIGLEERPDGVAEPAVEVGGRRVGGGRAGPEDGDQEEGRSDCPHGTWSVGWGRAGLSLDPACGRP